MVSGTTGTSNGRVCYGQGSSFINCPDTAPYVNQLGWLGIGTGTPASLFHVVGTDGGVRVDNTGNVLMMTRPSINYFRASDPSGSFAIATGGTTTRMFINTNGYIGIGKAQNTPVTMLDISGTLRISSEGETCNTSRLGAIRFQSGSFDVCRNATNGWEPLATTGANSAIDRITSNSMAGVTANDTGYISLTTGGVTGTVYFTPSGNLVNSGISTTGTISGTSGYLGNLRLGQTGAFTNAISPFQSYGDIVGDYAGIGGLELRNINGGPNADFRFVISDDRGAGGSTLNFSMSSSNNTNTLFGQPRNQMATLFVNGNTDAIARALAIGTLKAHPLILGTNNNEAMRIVSTGNVGIGTTAPGAGMLLDVSGSTRIRSALYIGSLSNNSRIYGLDTATYIGLHWGQPDITFNTNGLRRMTVASTNLGTEYGGRIGIGSMTYPSTTLDVGGSVRLRAEPSGNAGEVCDTNRLGAIRYTSGSFDICRSSSNGWEPLATATSATDISINTGLSGSIVFRDEFGKLKANNTFSISSTTGSIGIGAGAPASLGSNALYASGHIWGQNLTASNGRVGVIDNGGNRKTYINGNSIQATLADGTTASNFSVNTTGGNNSLVFIGSSDSKISIGRGEISPTTTLDISGTLRIANGGEACDTSRLGAIRYGSGSFDICRNITNGWEPIATATSATDISINTGLSGSLVFRDEYGKLKARNDLSVSSTTGSIGIGAGAPAYAGNNSLFALGNLYGNNLYAGSAGKNLYWGDGSVWIHGNDTTDHLAFIVSSTEALRVVSNGYVGIGTTTPQGRLHIVAPNNQTNFLMERTGVGNAGIAIGGSPSTISFGWSDTSLGYPAITRGIHLTSTTQRMGIFTADPSATLDIRGTLRIANGGESCDTSRLGSVRYLSGSFDICRNTSNGWEPIATATSATDIAINTGLSGSLVFRDELGKLKARNDLSVSSTTGSVGIGAGAPASLGNSGLYVSGSLQTNTDLILPYGNALRASGFAYNTLFQTGWNGFADYLALFTAGNGAENLGPKIVVLSNGNIGMGTATPTNALDVSGTLRLISSPLSCDTNHVGAIRFISGSFDVCRNTTNGWEPLATSGATSNNDRITSNSQAGVTANATGYISLTTGGVTGTVYFQPNGVLVNSGISTTSTISATSIYSGNHGISGSIIFRDANGLLTSTNNIVYSTTTGALRAPFMQAGAVGAFQFDNTGSNAIGGNSNSTAQYLTFITSATEAMRIVSSGYVGIGTASPTTNFEVLGNQIGGMAMPLSVRNSVAGGAAGFQATNSAGTTMLMGIGNNSNGSGLRNRGYIGFSNAAIPLIINAKTVISTGAAVNVSGPSTTLDISGTLKIANSGESCDTDRLGALRYNSGSFDVCRNTSNGWEPIATATSATDISINTGLSGSLVFRDELGKLKAYDTLTVSSTTGSVGIGTATPNAMLDISGTSTTMFRLGSVANNLIFRNNGAAIDMIAPNGLIINTNNNSNGFQLSTGNSAIYLNIAGTGLIRAGAAGTNMGVGIGTLGASTTLHVNGAIRMAADSSTTQQVCDTNRLGALRFISGSFDICRNTSNGWEALATATSATDIAINTGLSGSLVFRDDLGKLKARNDLSVSSTTGSVGIGAGAPSTLGNNALYVSGTGYMANGLLVGSTTTNAKVTSGADGNTFISLHWGQPDITFHTNNVRRMTVASSNLGAEYAGRIGIGSMIYPSATLHVSGTLKISNAGETCDSNRLGAVRYASGSFDVCANASNGWEPLATTTGSASGDRIVSGTTGMYTYNNTSASIATNGVERIVVGTNGNVGIAQQPATGVALSISGSTSITGRLGVLTPSGSNVMVGNLAGSNASGSENTGIGQGAFQNSSGDEGVAIGRYTGQWNTGNETTFIGSGSGLANTGNSVVGIGYNALQNNSASTVVAVGVNAGQANRPAGANASFLGNNSGQFNSGAFAAAVGMSAAQRNSGANLSAIGGYAAQYNSGADVVAIGYNAAQFNSGAGLVALGQLAANKNTAAQVTAIGYNAVSTVSNTYTNITGLGYDAQPTKSNQVMLGNTLTEEVATSGAGVFNKWVRVGSATTALMTSATITGAGSIMYDSTLNALRYSDGSQWNTIAGGAGAASADRITSGTTGMYTYNNTSATIATNGVERMVIGTNGNVGIAQQPMAGIALAVSGSSYFNGDINHTGSIYGTSDARLKTNVSNITRAVDTLSQLRPVSFEFKARRGHTEYGFLAQEVQKVYPALVNKAKDTSGTLSVNYTGLIAPMVQGLTEVNAEVKQLKDENAKLRNELEAMRAEIQAIAKQQAIAGAHKAH